MDLALDPSIDKDGDGYSPQQNDCDDYNLNRYPGNIEIPNNINDYGMSLKRLEEGEIEQSFDFMKEQGEPYFDFMQENQ